MAAMDEANAKPGVTSTLETAPANGVGGASKGGMIVGDVHSYRPRKGPLNAREVVVDVMLPIVVLLIGAIKQISTLYMKGRKKLHRHACRVCSLHSGWAR